MKREMDIDHSSINPYADPQNCFPNEAITEKQSHGWKSMDELCDHYVLRHETALKKISFGWKGSIGLYILLYHLGIS